MCRPSSVYASHGQAGGNLRWKEGAPAGTGLPVYRLPRPGQLAATDRKCQPTSATGKKQARQRGDGATSWGRTVATAEAKAADIKEEVSAKRDVGGPLLASTEAASEVLCLRRSHLKKQRPSVEQYIEARDAELRPRQGSAEADPRQCRLAACLLLSQSRIGEMPRPYPSASGLESIGRLACELRPLGSEAHAGQLRPRQPTPKPPSAVVVERHQETRRTQGRSTRLRHASYLLLRPFAALAAVTIGRVAVIPNSLDRLASHCSRVSSGGTSTVIRSDTATSSSRRSTNMPPISSSARLAPLAW